MMNPKLLRLFCPVLTSVAKLLDFFCKTVLPFVESFPVHFVVSDDKLWR